MSKLLKTTSRSLACALTDAELRVKGDELAVTCQEITNQEANEKQIKDSLKLKMSELASRRGTLALVISRREEYRTVEVEIEYLLTGDDQGQVRETRTDTGEIMIMRPPNDSERQPELE